jgi:hypothetical protein
LLCGLTPRRPCTPVCTNYGASEHKPGVAWNQHTKMYPAQPLHTAHRHGLPPTRAQITGFTIAVAGTTQRGAKNSFS